MSEGKGSGREGGRSLKTRVKTARKRSLSSTLWLERQLNDPYVARAKREGYRSRAAYKLIEMDDRYHLLKPGGRIVDLGAAPGGWSQIAADAREGEGRQGEGRRRRSSRHGADRRRRIRGEGLQRRRRAGLHQEHARRRGRWRDVRHGRERHWPQADGSSAHRRAGRACRRIRHATCWRPAASSSPRCCRAAPRASCSRGSSAISRPCAM